MKNRRFIIVLSVCVSLVLIIGFCAIFNNFKSSDNMTKSGNSYVNKNYETNVGKDDVSNPSNDNNQSHIQNEKLDFFISEQSVSKTKNIVGETTMFAINFKVFATNNTSVSKTLRASAFSAEYDISSFATFYKLECNDSELLKTLPVGESEDFDFSLVYVITDTEKFKDNQKYDLTVNDMAEEIISSFM